MSKLKWHYLGLAVAAAGLIAGQAVAQSRYATIPTANSTQLPQGISVKKTPAGDVYVDSQGRVLYGMDTSQLRLRTRTPFKHCREVCAQEWEPVAPPPGTAATPAPAPTGRGAPGSLGFIGGAGAQAATAAAQAQVNTGGGLGRGAAAPASGPDWTVIEGLNGPQLLYKRTHLVFVHKVEPTSTKWDASPDWLRDEPVGPLFNALRYVPPVPKLASAPKGVTPLFLDGAYVLVDKEQRVLYSCVANCAKQEPLLAGLMAEGGGDWTVSRDSDAPQWLYKGKPVYVSQGAPKTAAIPAGAALLRP